MAPKTYLKIVLSLALAGTLFSGYLSAPKLFTGACAFNEPCPYFLGYPACWYGLAMFLAMLIVAAFGFYGAMGARAAARIITWISSAGIFFAGSFTAQEIYRWIVSAGHPGYGLALPTCVYGLAFYAAIFTVSMKIKTKP